MPYMYVPLCLQCEYSVLLSVQVYWNYITHMLTNLGSVSLERIHMMLGMFGNLKKDVGLNELRTFLEKKVLEQQLACTDGYYRLVQ